LSASGRAGRTNPHQHLGLRPALRQLERTLQPDVGRDGLRDEVLHRLATHDAQHRFHIRRARADMPYLHPAPEMSGDAYSGMLKGHRATSSNWWIPRTSPWAGKSSASPRAPGSPPCRSPPRTPQTAWTPTPQTSPSGRSARTHAHNLNRKKCERSPAHRRSDRARERRQRPEPESTHRQHRQHSQRERESREPRAPTFSNASCPSPLHTNNTPTQNTHTHTHTHTPHKSPQPLLTMPTANGPALRSMPILSTAAILSKSMSSPPTPPQTIA
jgi:hypothetical protein